MRDFRHAYDEAALRAGGPKGVLVLRRRTMVACAAAAALTASWAAAATWYIASRDELAQRFFVVETEMKYAYEDRIGQLTGRLEREVTRNLVERNAVDARIGAVAARQSEIEARHAWLKAATERGLAASPASGFAGLASPPRHIEPRPTERTHPGEAKPSPLDEIGGLRLSVPPAEAQAALPKDRLSAVEGSLRRIADDEQAVLVRIGRGARTRLDRLRTALESAGIRTDRAAQPATAAGGPLVPVPPGSVPFGIAAQALDLDLEEIGRLTASVRTVPLGMPLDGELDPTSPFGYRIDPFTRGAALHTGMDLRVEPGSPARATAAGRVTVADYSGGYGNMVEVDHGGGLVTRYGHLSSFAVSPGDRVETGQVIGRTGSTGRSTGPHLHYETRVDGEPVNPARFLEAGRLLAHEGI